jgi:hypothetical protein
LNTVDIQFEFDRSKALYKKYFKFERKKAFGKVPIKLLYGIWAVLLIIGISARVDALWIIGLICIASTTLFLLYFFLKFQLAFNKFIKELEKKSKSEDLNFRFGFNSESIIYQSETLYSEIKWPAIKGYVLNDEDIYLYLENRKLLDIISKRILEERMFEDFKTMLLDTCREIPT